MDLEFQDILFHSCFGARSGFFLRCWGGTSPDFPQRARDLGRARNAYRPRVQSMKQIELCFEVQNKCFKNGFWTSQKIFGRPKKCLDVQKTVWTSKTCLDVETNFWTSNHMFGRPTSKVKQFIDIRCRGFKTKRNSFHIL